jgi:hypothetical protein
MSNARGLRGLDMTYGIVGSGRCNAYPHGPVVVLAFSSAVGTIGVMHSVTAAHAEATASRAGAETLAPEPTTAAPGAADAGNSVMGAVPTRPAE